MLFCTKIAGGVGDGAAAVAPGAGVAVGDGTGVGLGNSPLLGLNGTATSVALLPLGHETPADVPSATR